MHSQLKQLTDRIQDAQLRSKVASFLENPTLELNGKIFTGPSFEVSPGSLSRHHVYVGGYLEHILATAKIALALTDVSEELYGCKVNRDYIIAGVLLHDIFKPITYVQNEEGKYVSAPLADYLDHISLATAELVRRDFPLPLIHIVTAHYGGYGPISPRTLEALIVHLADDTDARLNGQMLEAAWHLTRKATGEGLPDLNSKEAFEIVQAKTAEGWEGVKKTAAKINRERSQKT
jgi:7,8-dihydroneopterin 2',3'-cyclic phosphate phosphodiesterase